MTAAAPLGHVVVDRDGVLNRERPDGWLSAVEDWAWEDGAVAGLARLAGAGVRVSVATNQSGIGRGVVAAAAVAAVHEHLAAELDALGVDLVGVFVCPHAPDAGCRCRKPAPGLVLDAVAASGVAPERTVLVGDAGRDLAAAAAAGVAAALVRTGKGRATERAGVAVPVHDDLAAVVDALLSGGRGQPRASAPPAAGDP